MAALLACAAARASAADPVIAAAGDIACSSTHRADATAAIRRRPPTCSSTRAYRRCCRSATRSTRTATLLGLHELLRPELGPREVDHLPGARQPRVPDVGRLGLLRLLQRHGQRHRPGRRPQQGLLQLRRRHLAPDRAQLERHCTIVVVRRGLARRRPGSRPTSPHTRTTARSPTGTTRSFNSGQRRQRSSAMQPLLQDLYNANADVILGGHAHHYERFAPQNPSGAARQRARHPPVRGRAPAAPSGPAIGVAEAQQPGAPEHHLRRAEADAPSHQLRLAVRARRRADASRTPGRRLLPRHARRRRPTRRSRPPPGQPDRHRRRRPGRAAAGRPRRTTSASPATASTAARTQVATSPSTTTSYTDSSLAPGPYSYTVRPSTPAGQPLRPEQHARPRRCPTRTKPRRPGTLTATGRHGPGRAQLAGRRPTTWA